jgi:hypothetical protein
MQIARGLPMHLKVYAVEGVFSDVFGVLPPFMPADAAAPMKNGTWLSYLSTVAAAAGHPVPAIAQEPVQRETLAWTGVEQGFADRLRAVGPYVSNATPLALVTYRVIDRLDEQFQTAHRTLGEGR